MKNFLYMYHTRTYHYISNLKIRSMDHEIILSSNYLTIIDLIILIPLDDWNRYSESLLPLLQARSDKPPGISCGDSRRGRNTFLCASPQSDVQ